MTPERWQKVNDLFHSVVSREPAERAAFLDQACAGDQELRREVESLIESSEKQDSFIDSPAFQAGAALLEDAHEEIAEGRLLGHYKILSRLGSGGMGKVYLSQDSKLGRKVALKLLPSDFTRDEQRVRRFAQEARAASALNHPNILTIYDVDEVDGVNFIATEYIEGETLRQLIAEHRLEENEALGIARQVASALSAAHQAGIVHRDIKPENIMLRGDGIAKILDFGLAKLTERCADNGDSESPRYSEVRTDTGVVIGTVSYMSPEQAKGQQVDQRSDIFSFGLVLYEMLAGKKAFRRDSDVDTLHAIIHDEPPRLSSLRSKVPAEIGIVVRRCLEKDPELRYPSGRELTAALEHAVGAIFPSAGKAVRTRAAWRNSSIAVGIIAVVVALTIGGFLWFRHGGSPTRPSLTRMKAVPFTSFPGNEYLPSLSPDGNQIAFCWNGEDDRNSYIYVKQLSSAVPLRLSTLPQSGSLQQDMAPAWSPDGQRVAFLRRTLAGDELLVVPALTGPERKLYRMDPNTINFGVPTLAWSSDGKFLAFTRSDPKEKRQKVFLLTLDTLVRESLTSPSSEYLGDFNPTFSPDGQSVAFIRSSAGGASAIYTVPVAGGKPRRLDCDSTSFMGLTWSADGREIIFAEHPREGPESLWRIPVTGGAQERIPLDGSSFAFPSISRRGNRLAYVQGPPEDNNIYRIEVSGATSSKRPSTKLIASTRDDGGAEYSPDGKKIVFHSDRTGPLEIWMCDSDGSHLVQVTSLDKRSGSPRWSPDGRQIVFDVYDKNQGDIYVVSLDGGVPRPIVTGDSDDHWPSWSADGKWIYFTSNRTGTVEVWRIPAQGGDAVQVTTQGGFLPRESPDGKFVYYGKELNRGLWRMPVDGGEEQLFIDKVESEIGLIAKEGIYYIDTDEAGQAVLDIFDFVTRKQRHVAVIGKVNFREFCVSLSPDHRQVLYTQIDLGGADIMLVENFR